MNVTLAQKHHDLAVHQAKQLARVLREVNIDQPATANTRHIASPAGSELRLRGIPVVGAQGVGGTMRGCRPGDIARHAQASATDIPRRTIRTATGDTARH